MVKSKINTYGFWIPPTVLIIVSGFSVFTLFDEPNPNDIVPITVLWIIFLILLVPPIFYSKIVTVDPINRTIAVTRLFTRQCRVYNYSDFDGYVDMMVIPGRGQPYCVLYLVKDEKFVQVISGKIYSNLNEIEEAISDIEYLGERESSMLIHLKILFGYKVLNDKS